MGEGSTQLLDIVYSGAESNVNVGDVFDCVQLLSSSVELEHWTRDSHVYEYLDDYDNFIFVIME